MGKIKRERQKYHIAAGNQSSNIIEEDQSSITLPVLPIKTHLDASENIFSGINIQLDHINKFVEIASTPSTSKSKVNVEKNVQSILTKDGAKASYQKVNFPHTPPGKHLTKKEKIALKHQKLMEKLDATHKARLEISNNQKKQKPKRSESHHFNQTLAASKSEFRSLLTPAAVKSCNETSMKNLNVFSIPLLKDDLPSLDSIFKQKFVGNNDIRHDHEITMKSKNIEKKSKSKKNFVANYEFLRKAIMVKKKK